MNSISILFSGRGSNAHNIIDNIIQKKLKFNIKNIICNNKNSPAIETFSKKNIFVDVLNSNDYRNNENFNNMLKESGVENNTDKIKKLKHSGKIREQVSIMMDIKKKYVR